MTDKTHSFLIRCIEEYAADTGSELHETDCIGIITNRAGYTVCDIGEYILKAYNKEADEYDLNEVALEFFGGYRSDDIGNKKIVYWPKLQKVVTTNRL